MSVEPKCETVSLFGLWKAHRDDLVPFGAACEMARAGKIPGAVPQDRGTPAIAADRVPEALAAMKRG